MLTGKSKSRKQPRKITIVFVLELLIVLISKLLVIKAKSSELLGRDKIFKVGNKYGNTSGTTKKIMSVAKTYNRLYKLKTYKEVIIDLIYSK